MNRSAIHDYKHTKTEIWYAAYCSPEGARTFVFKNKEDAYSFVYKEMVNDWDTDKLGPIPDDWAEACEKFYAQDGIDTTVEVLPQYILTLKDKKEAVDLSLLENRKCSE